MFYDKRAREPNFNVGERVFLLKPSETTGANRKFARPIHGPYRIVSVEPNNASICRIDRPQDEPIRVALQRLRQCPDEFPNEYWLPDKPRKRGPKSQVQGQQKADQANEDQVTVSDASPLPISTGDESA